MKEKYFLFLKTSSLGDILHTIPCALLIKERVPNAVIDWVVEEEYVPLLEAFPIVDQVLGVPWRGFRKGTHRFSHVRDALRGLRRGCYDVSIDFQGNTKSGFLHAMTESKRKVGIENPPEFLNRWTNGSRYSLPNEQIQRRYLSLLCQALKWELPQKVPSMYRGETRSGRLLVAPCSRWDAKMIPFERLEEVIKAPFDLICGSDEEMELLQGFFQTAENRLVKPSFREWIEVTKQAIGVVAVDSAQLHVASLFGVPTFSFFGPSNPNRYAPIGALHHRVAGSCPLNVVFTDRCPHLRTCVNKGCSKKIRSFEQEFATWKECILER